MSPRKTNKSKSTTFNQPRDFSDSISSLNDLLRRIAQGADVNSKLGAVADKYHDDLKFDCEDTYCEAYGKVIDELEDFWRTKIGDIEIKLQELKEDFEDKKNELEEEFQKKEADTHEVCTMLGVLRYKTNNLMDAQIMDAFSKNIANIPPAQLLSLIEIIDLL